MKLKIILLVFFTFTAFGVNSQVNKYVANQVIVKDVNTDEVVQDFGVGQRAVIVYYIGEDNIEWIGVTLGHTTVYQIQAVQTIVDYPEKGIKIEMKRGGVMENSEVVGTISVFRLYDLENNKVVPELIRTKVDNADVVFEFHGIVAIE